VLKSFKSPQKSPGLNDRSGHLSIQSGC